MFTFGGFIFLPIKKFFYDQEYTATETFPSSRFFQRIRHYVFFTQR